MMIDMYMHICVCVHMYTYRHVYMYTYRHVYRSIRKLRRSAVQIHEFKIHVARLPCKSVHLRFLAGLCKSVQIHGACHLCRSLILLLPRFHLSVRNTVASIQSDFQAPWRADRRPDPWGHPQLSQKGNMGVIILTRTVHRRKLPCSAMQICESNLQLHVLCALPCIRAFWQVCANPCKTTEHAICAGP